MTVFVVPTIGILKKVITGYDCGTKRNSAREIRNDIIPYATVIDNRPGSVPVYMA